MLRPYLFSVLALAATAASAATTLLDDNYNTAGSASSYTVTNLNGIGTADFGFDYSGLSIPEAPNTGAGDTAFRGFVTQVNVTGTAGSSAVEAFTNIDLNGAVNDYAVQVDFYGKIGCGLAGTTEEVDIGIFQTGTRVISWSQNATLGASTDGYWFVGEIDGGNTIDFAFQKGNPSGFSANEEAGLTWGNGADGSVTGGARFLDTPYTAEVFGTAACTGTDDGVVGNQWNTLKFVWTASTGELKLYISNPQGFRLLATYNDPADTYTSGKVLLGHVDAFSSRNTASYLIFDNLLIEQGPFNSSVQDWALFD